MCEKSTIIIDEKNYQAMALDEIREKNAQAWIEGVIGDIFNCKQAEYRHSILKI